MYLDYAIDQNGNEIVCAVYQCGQTAVDTYNQVEDWLCQAHYDDVLDQWQAESIRDAHADLR